MIIVTNNNRVVKKFENKYNTEFIDGNYLDVLIKVRDYLHQGYVLLSHPLSGSIKPGETPFKSVMISKGSDDYNSESLISDAITIATRMLEESKVKEYTDKLIDDFSLVDLDVISSAIESHTQFGINA